MERESFEDEEVAGVLNKHFISIKVDREERPDIDHIYMSVCQALTGHGGWPLTIIMTPDKKPFYSGTYFPKNDKRGIPGILTLFNRVIDAWDKNRESLLKSADQIINAIDDSHDTSGELDARALLQNAYKEFKYDFDSLYGGFSNAPKFPSPHNLYFLLRYWYVYKDSYALEMVEKTLESMYRGGIFDHISGGFSRYSTDRKWLIPHFEKMLYDNSLLAIAYLETYQATKKVKYADIARQIFTYILRDMTSSDGGFFSAEDADSEGEEGKFYVWSVDEIKKVLGENDGEKYCKYFDITQKGNFEGQNIPNLIKSTYPEEDKTFIENCKQKLFEYREKRVHPYKDDKILTAWNGLMIAALAMGGRILDEKSYTEAAKNAANFIQLKLVRKDGRLMARYRDGEAAFPAYIDDYAFLIWGLIELYETTYIPEYLFNALNFNTFMLKHFWDDKNGGLFIYGNDGEQLITRPKEIYDGAMPSGNSVATLNFIRLARLTGKSEYEDLAEQQFKTFLSTVIQAPHAFSFYLTALLFSESKSKEVIITGDSDYKGTEEMVKILQQGLNPLMNIVVYTDKHKDLNNLIPYINNYKAMDGKATAYICENFTCQSPITSLSEFKERINEYGSCTRL